MKKKQAKPGLIVAAAIAVMVGLALILATVSSVYLKTQAYPDAEHPDWPSGHNRIDSDGGNFHDAGSTLYGPQGYHHDGSLTDWISNEPPTPTPIPIPTGSPTPTPAPPTPTPIPIPTGSPTPTPDPPFTSDPPACYWWWPFCL